VGCQNGIRCFGETLGDRTRPDSERNFLRIVPQAGRPSRPDARRLRFYLGPRGTNAQPDAILNTINGDSNVAFFRASGIKFDDVPTISFSISEQELSSLSTSDIVGDYAASNYFHSVDRPQARAFINRFQARFGAQRLTSNPMEAAYFGVHLWAQAGASAGSDDVRAIHAAMKRQELALPPKAASVLTPTRNTPRKSSASAASSPTAASKSSTTPKSRSHRIRTRTPAAKPNGTPSSWTSASAGVASGRIRGSRATNYEPLHPDYDVTRVRNDLCPARVHL
jgi:hypothetical protein